MDEDELLEREAGRPRCGGSIHSHFVKLAPPGARRQGDKECSEDAPWEGAQAVNGPACCRIRQPGLTMHESFR